MANEVVETSKINRKVFIYEICCRKKGISEDQEFLYVEKLFQEIESSINILEYNNTEENRWFGVESVKFDGFNIENILICCKYRYKPNLINVQNRSERTSPKSDFEGDKEKTHILIKGNFIAYERRRNGTSISVFSKFLNEAWGRIKAQTDATIDRIVLRQVIDNDFLEIIKKSSKIKNAKFIVKSNLTGSEFFDFSDDNGVEDSYSLEIKAKRKNTIGKQGLIQKLTSMLAANKVVEKVTISINDEDNIPRVINTEEFAKQFNIYVEKNDNGEVIDEDIFDKLREIL